MKTYDIYAKQNGKWQRKGIQGEPTLPEYDGTVIIEKLNALGWRRFNDTLTPIETDYDLFGGISDTETLFNNLYNEFGFSVKFEEEFEGEVYTLEFKMTCLLKVSQADYNVIWIETDTGERAAVYEGIGNPSVESLLNEFNRQLPISSTSSATVDEWLLANTEGVSV